MRLGADGQRYAIVRLRQRDAVPSIEAMEDRTKPSGSRLSPREEQVLVIASLGLTNAQMADELHVSVHAVKFHLAAIYRKLAVANRTEAASAYLRGLASAQSPHVPSSTSTDDI